MHMEPKYQIFICKGNCVYATVVPSYDLVTRVYTTEMQFSPAKSHESARFPRLPFNHQPFTARSLSRGT